jgi:autotransporter translocation and assembly factor TamB
VRIAGAASAKGEIGPAPTSRLSLAIATLAFDGMTLDGLTAFAEGPVHALKMSGALTAIRRDGLSAIENVSAAGTADFGRRRIIRLETFDAEIAGETLRLDKPARFDFADGVAIDGLKASIGQTGVFSFDGAFARPRWRGRLALQEAPLSRAASLIDADIDFDTDRKVPGRGVFRIKTDLADPATSALAGEFSWDGRTLDVADDGKTEGLDIALKLPMRLVRAPALRVDTTGALSGAARYEGRAETVAVFLPAALQSIEGALTFDGSAGGTLARPKLTGALVISKGAYTELASGLSILDIDAQAKAESAGEATRIDFSASGRGPSQTAKTIRADGALTLGPAPRADVRISLAKAKLSAGPIASVSATGEATLAGAFSDLHASGDLSISALQSEIVTPKPTGLVDIDVVRVDGDGASGHERAPPPRSSPVTLNIRLRGDDRLFIRGRGLDSEWRADMKLEGRADAPLVTGVMTLKDGAIEFAGRLFKMTKGEVAFDALSPNNPMLDMRAERETEDGTVAAIVIAGRAKAPKIALESTPARPTEDVMALLLFDKPASDLSAIESLQVADSLVALGGVGPFGGAGLSGSARQALGLDLLNVAVAEEDAGATALTVGKYVSPDLFISATQDARGENGSIRVEYEITDSITIETELRQDGDQTVSANWKRDF